MEDDGDDDDDDAGLDKGAMEKARESVRLKKAEEERLLKVGSRVVCARVVCAPGLLRLGCLRGTSALQIDVCLFTVYTLDCCFDF